MVKFREMREQEFSEKLRGVLGRTLLNKYRVSVGESILYKLEIDASGKLRPNNYEEPKRGQYAFQTDVLIAKVKPTIPLVVIELKTQNFSTHDVITYSAKASHHKEIYPYLRYGFIVGGLVTLSRRFLTHNQAIDFAIALPDDASMEDCLVGPIKNQIKNAEKLAKLLRTDRSKFTRYETILNIR